MLLEYSSNNVTSTMMSFLSAVLSSVIRSLSVNALLLPLNGPSQVKKEPFSIWTASSEKQCLPTCAKSTNSDYPAHLRRISWGLCSSFIHSVVSNDSVSGQWRPWLGCANAQADQGIRCPHMPEDTFSHGAAHIYTNSKKSKKCKILDYHTQSQSIIRACAVCSYIL